MVLATIFKKGWKDHLLSSGVPLEYSVRRVFEELGIRQPEEFKYERKNADRVPQVFSVDIVSTGINLQRRFWVESLVECKYRHDGTTWIFTSMKYHTVSRPRFLDLFVTLDQCSSDKKLDPTILNELRDYFPLCGKGIELLLRTQIQKVLSKRSGNCAMASLREPLMRSFIRKTEAWETTLSFS